MSEERLDWKFSPENWESSVEEPTRPRKVTENSRTEDSRAEIQYPRTTGSADDRPFITPPRPVPEKGPRIQTSPFPPMYAGDTPTATFPVVNKALEEDKPDAYAKETKGEYRVPLTAFEQELRRLINRFSMEGHSNTPDNILAEYLCSCLDAFGRAVSQREQWFGRRTF